MLNLIHVERVPWWKWLLLSLGVITLTVGVMLIGLVALIYLGVDFQDYLYVARPAWIFSGWVAFWIAVILMIQSLGPVFGALLFRPARQLALGLCRWPADGRDAALRVLAGGALAVTVQWLWAKVGAAPDDPFRLVEGFVYAVAHGGAFWPWLWLLVAAVLVGPLAEEIVYRGLLQGMIRRRWGVLAGMLGSAALFGLAHGLANALPAALLGLYFSYQVERDRSLVGAFVLHALHNLAAVLVMAAG